MTTARVVDDRNEHLDLGCAAVGVARGDRVRKIGDTMRMARSRGVRCGLALLSFAPSVGCQLLGGFGSISLAEGMDATVTLRDSGPADAFRPPDARRLTDETGGSGSGTSPRKGMDASDALVPSIDAGSCHPIEGGLPCSPGRVDCADANCSLPAQECCDDDSQETCEAVGAQCSAVVITCDETADCADGSLCCVMAPVPNSGTISCQPGPHCPTGAFASTQVCKTNAECASSSGVCTLYKCGSHPPRGSCTNANPGFCTAVSP
jgi:hypothetical protein